MNLFRVVLRNMIEANVDELKRTLQDEANRRLNDVQAELQSQVDGWMKHIVTLDKRIKNTDKNSPERDDWIAIQAEFKGRIYAARFVEELLFIKLDTDFTARIYQARERN